MGEKQGPHAITYRIPRFVSGQELIDAHGTCMRELMDDGWEIGVSSDEQKNQGIRLRASHSTLKGLWIFPSFRWYDFVLASEELIIPTDMYCAGDELAFALSDSTGEDIGLLRWTYDTRSKLFRRLQRRWKKYIDTLDIVLSPLRV
jgi:hypothetical protein